jgi:hypothetical protein
LTLAVGVDLSDGPRDSNSAIAAESRLAAGGVDLVPRGSAAEARPAQSARERQLALELREVGEQ